VRDEERGPGQLLADREELLVKVVAGHLVQGPEGLVEEEDLRRDAERAGDRDAHLLAARELARVVVLAVGEPDEGEALGRDLRAARGRRSVKLHRQLDVLLDRVPRKQRRLLEDERELLDRALRRHAVDDDLAAGDGIEPGDELQDRRLAAAARADQRDEVAALRLEAHVVEDHRPVAVALHDAGELDDGEGFRRHAAKGFTG
jgi:hypothetical protein